MGKCKPNRDCLKIPFPPECFKFCVEQILRVARPKEKIEILGMDRDLAEAIFRTYNYGRKSIKSFDDLSRSLSHSQNQRLIDIFSNLNQSQLDYFIVRIN